MRYNIEWREMSDLEIEMECIRNGGQWTEEWGVCGKGLSHHYEQMRRLIWPRLATHRWHDLCRDEMVRNKVTVFMGPKSSAKTHEAAWYALCKYFVDPDNTCVLVSSTDIRGLRMRVWAEILMLWNEAIERYDWLPGHYLESRIAITTDELDDGDFEKRTVRDMRKAIVGIPCMQGGHFVGLGKYCGIKQKHVMVVADELQFMGASFLTAFSNLDANEDFQAICLGNPNDIMDQLGKAAEPIDGWGTHMEPEKTAVWQTRFMGGKCINLIGTDSPNFDVPPDQPTPFKFLISRKTIESTAAFFGKDSIEFYSQCKGCMRISQLSRRVISRELCRQAGVFEDVDWEGPDRTKIAGLDAAYGGDRCVCGHIEFGREVGGKTVIKVYPPQLVPVKVGADVPPEQGIAEWCRDYCAGKNIPPENFFHDSTGRGSLGTYLARVWSDKCNPVEFGGEPTNRPVSLDMYWLDPKTHARRLKTCKEHYRKFVTELWFSVRYAIESAQLRSLPEEVMEEGCMREWQLTKDSRIELETKQEMKDRVGRSPDMFDWLSICVEGARRRGFNVSKLANETGNSLSWTWLKKLSEDSRKKEHAHDLNYEVA